jgi:hypothetical protein
MMALINKYWPMIVAIIQGQPTKRKLKLAGKQLFYGLLAYNWVKYAKPEYAGKRQKVILLLVQCGWTGMAFELMEKMAWWPTGERTNDFLGRMKSNVDAIKVWVADLEAAGLWAYIIDNNSNGDENQELRTADTLFAINDYINKQLGGFKNVIRLPVSETDNDLNASVRSAYIARVEAMWPDERTSAYASRRGAAKYAETHLQSTSANGPVGDDWFAVSDSGGILRELCKGNVTGNSMDANKAGAWVDKMLTRSSCILYALGTEVDEVIIAKVGTIGRLKGV